MPAGRRSTSGAAASASPSRANGASPPKKRIPSPTPSSGSASSAEDIYEVETIVKHRVNKKGKTQYFLKWKGYGEKDNTWNDEEDLNCEELLAAYWAKVKKNSSSPSPAKPGRGRPPKKAVTASTSAAAAAAAASPARSGRSFPSTGALPAKRKSTSANGSSPKRLKSPKKSDGAESVAASGSESEYEDGTPPLSVDWERYVTEIKTIERDNEGTLCVLILWNGEKRYRVPAETVYRSCPQKMIKFYESHLRFKKRTE